MSTAPLAAASVAPGQPPATESLRTTTDRRLGMALFLGSWTMAFGTLLLSFLVVRRHEEVWPPEGVVLPSMPLAWTATAILVLSSLAAHRAVAGARRDAARWRSWWGLALVTGLAFAWLQSALWLQVWSGGGRPADGLYASIFYALTWFHAAHVACGLVALAWVAVQAGRGRCGPARLSPLLNAATFWHFVGVVWLVLFLVFLVL